MRTTSTTTTSVDDLPDENLAMPPPTSVDDLPDENPAMPPATSVAFKKNLLPIFFDKKNFNTRIYCGVPTCSTHRFLKVVRI